MLSIFRKHRYIDVDINVSPNTNLEHLTPKHKVTILAPSFNFLCYKRSHARLWPGVDRFIHNFSEYLESNEEILELLEHYKMADGIDDALRERYINKMYKRGDGSTPGLVGLRIPPLPNCLPLLSRPS